MRSKKAKHCPTLTMEMITLEAIRVLEESLAFTKQLRAAKDETEVCRLKKESLAKAEYWRRVGDREIPFPQVRPQWGQYRELLELYNLAKME